MTATPMSATSRPVRAILGAIFGVVLALAGPAADPALAQAGGQRIRGAIVKIDADVMVVRPESGDEVTVRLADPVAVGTVARATAADIGPGTYIGAGARPQKDGTLRAVQVMIFPENLRGIGEGHRDWSVMPEATMTNATVADTVKVVDGQSLTLTYKGGEKTLVIAPDSVVLKVLPATRADLKPGATVALTASRLADGTLTVNRVTVSTNGVPLPM